jgi:hypothetical protein
MSSRAGSNTPSGCWPRARPSRRSRTSCFLVDRMVKGRWLLAQDAEKLKAREAKRQLL